MEVPRAQTARQTVFHEQEGRPRDMDRQIIGNFSSKSYLLKRYGFHMSVRAVVHGTRQHIHHDVPIFCQCELELVL